jgi:hypothetical protein
MFKNGIKMNLNYNQNFDLVTQLPNQLKEEVFKLFDFKAANNVRRVSKDWAEMGKYSFIIDFFHQVEIMKRSLYPNTETRGQKRLILDDDKVRNVKRRLFDDAV